jgi:hypothetical protein
MTAPAACSAKKSSTSTCSDDHGPALVRYTFSVPMTVPSAIRGRETIAR